jgi:hypothetical protein
MADESRNDANLRQFRSRAQQPKVLRAGPATPAATTNPAPPVNIYIVHDMNWGSVSDQLDATRFKYTGTSPSITPYESMCSRRQVQTCMNNSFQW